MEADPKSSKEEAEAGAVVTDPETGTWRHRCGCLRTSEKLRHILNTFPSPPPPTPAKGEDPCVIAYCHQYQPPQVFTTSLPKRTAATEPCADICALKEPQVPSRSWRVPRMLIELVQLLQLSVTATALALYYLIYCYMQLVYYILKSAIYFHQADGPMKITIAVMTLTTLVVAFNIVLRIEKLIKVA